IPGASNRNHRACRCRVRAAFCPARRNPALPFVRTAFIAALWRDARPRLLAAPRAWRATADLDAAALPSFFNAPEIARERLGEVRRCPDRPFAKSRVACFCTFLLPRLGAPSFTPARRAFDSPIAIACCGD